VAPAQPDPAAPTSTPALRIAALGVIAVLLVAALATGVLWLRARSSLADANALAAAQSGALAAAEQYAVYLTSYDYRHIDADFNRVLDHASASGKFKSQFVKASQDLRALIIQYKGVSTATVTGSGVSNGAALDRVTVVLFVDQTLTNSNSPTPRVDRNEVQIVVVKQGDSWLIDNVTLPNQAAAAAGTPSVSPSPAASPGASPAATPSAASPASTPLPTPTPAP
jgi:Mce-associated membrane protein